MRICSNWILEKKTKNQRKNPTSDEAQVTWTWRASTGSTCRRSVPEHSVLGKKSLAQDSAAANDDVLHEDSCTICWAGNVHRCSCCCWGWWETDSGCETEEDKFHAEDDDEDDEGGTDGGVAFHGGEKLCCEGEACGTVGVHILLVCSPAEDGGVEGECGRSEVHTVESDESCVDEVHVDRGSSDDLFILPAEEQTDSMSGTIMGLLPVTCAGASPGTWCSGDTDDICWVDVNDAETDEYPADNTDDSVPSGGADGILAVDSLCIKLRGRRMRSLFPPGIKKPLIGKSDSDTEKSKQKM